MPAQSKAQQRFFGWLKSNPQERKKRGITAKTADDFAGTKHDGLPERKESMDFTEFSKMWEGYKDLPVGKIDKQMFKPHAMKDKRKFKQMAQQKYEYGADNPGWGEGGKPKKDQEAKSKEQLASEYKERRQAKEKANRAGKGTHQKVVKGIKGTDADKLEDNYNSQTAKKEALDFSSFLDALQDPLYEVKNVAHVCPKGTKYDKDSGTCVPTSQKNTENPSQREMTAAVGGYNVWGATGLNGDGYALAVEEDMQHDYEKYDEEDKEFKKRDEKMKYGKAGKPSSLRPGEVRKPNSRGGYDSNK